MTLNIERLQTFVALSERKAALTAELDDIRRDLDELEPGLIEQFADDGIRNVNLNGHTVYVQAQLWASPVEGDYERACDALVEAGLAEFVGRRFNSNTLSAWVREHVRDERGDYPEQLDEHLPVAFLGSIKAEKKWSVRIRKSGGKGRR